MVEILLGARSYCAQHLSHLVGERTRCNHALLRAFQLCGRDHFHGLSYLLRVLNRLKTPSDVEQVGHENLIKPRRIFRSRFKLRLDLRPLGPRRYVAAATAVSCFSFQSSLKS